MKSAKDIEQALRQTDLDIDIHARTDRRILSELADAYRESVRTPSAPATPRWRTVTESWIVRLAAAVAIVGIVGLLALRRVPREPGRIPYEGATLSAAEMLTVGQLKAAYGRGGLEELEAQCENAAEKVDVKLSEISITDLIVELKGK